VIRENECKRSGSIFGARIGVERLVSRLVGAKHIGEVQPFPKIPGVVYEL